MIGRASLAAFHPLSLRKQALLTFPLHFACEGKQMKMGEGFFMLLIFL